MPEMPINGNDLPSPENITTFHHQIFITARWLAARFGIDYGLMCRVVDDIEATGEVEDLIYRDGSQIWVCDAAFGEICQHPFVDDRFAEDAREAVLHLLGHYQASDKMRWNVRKGDKRVLRGAAA